MEQRRIEVGEVALVVLEAGRGGAPLLVVHGFTGAKEDFGEEVDRLAEQGFWVVAPDLRGHGASDKPDGEDAYGLEVFADDLWALVEQLGWERFDLLGHSMGGMIAQLMVLDRPERVRRLILMDTHHGRVGGIDPDLVATGIELARNQGLGVIQQLLKAGAGPTDSPAHRRVCAERAGYEEWCDEKFLACSPDMYARMLSLLTGTVDRLAELGAVGCPTLVVVGELDEPFLAASHRIAGAIPGARLEVLPAGGHCPQFEATDAWRRAVDSFLAAA